MDSRDAGTAGEGASAAASGAVAEPASCGFARSTVGLIRSGWERRRAERRGAAAGELGEVGEEGERVVAVEDVELPAAELLAASAHHPGPPPRSRSTPPAARTDDPVTSGSGSSVSSTRAPPRSAAPATPG